jgi:hypothetical protein
VSGGILAVDMGRLSAFAYAEPGRRPVWGHTSLGDAEASGGRLLTRAREWLIALCDYHRPAWIAQEAPYFQHPDQKTGKPFKRQTAARLQRFAAIPEGVAFELGVSYRETMIRDVALHFLGSEGPRMRREKKKQQTVVICKLHGWAPLTQDEGDALALLSYMEWSLSPAQARLRGEGPLFMTPTDNQDKRV